jgi:hypothetical protein
MIRSTPMAPWNLMGLQKQVWPRAPCQLVTQYEVLYLGVQTTCIIYHISIDRVPKNQDFEAFADFASFQSLQPTLIRYIAVDVIPQLERFRFIRKVQPKDRRNVTRIPLWRHRPSGISPSSVTRQSCNNELGLKL